MNVERIAFSNGLLLTDIGQLHHQPGAAPLTRAWMLLKGDTVEAIGTEEPPSWEGAQRDLGGGIVLPAPIDSHTHLLFGGDRCDEFASRARGESYEARLAAGGGIHATVKATAQAHDEVLMRTALQRVQHAMHLGVGAVEVKTGYGLTLDGESRMIKLLTQLRAVAPIPVFPTLLMHVPPPDTDRSVLVQQAIDHLIPKAAELGFGFDVFVEDSAYNVDEADRMLAEAARLGMRLHVHADQLTPGGGAGLAARYGARSAEHLEFASPEDLEAMAEAGVVANLLPGAWLQTGCHSRPPIAAMRDAGVPLGIATDLNPGSSYLYDLVTAASLAVSAFGLTCDEALAGITTQPSRILGIENQGHLMAGSKAIPWWLPLPDPAALFQRLGAPQRGLQFIGEQNS